MRAGKYLYYLQSIFTLLRRVSPLGTVLAAFLGGRFRQPFAIRLPSLNLDLNVRSAMDIWSVKETLLDNYYTRCGYPIGSGWTVIDIGGGIGDFTIQAACAAANNCVHAFEPTPSSFSLLEQNLRANGIQNVEIYPTAVWSDDQEVVIDTGSGEPVQFTSQAYTGELLEDGKVRVQANSLNTLLARLGIQRCDLMKLDCEGAEYEILFHTPDAALQQIDRIVMEYHDNAGPNTHRDMERFLTEKGYQVEVFPSPVHPYLGYLRAARTSAQAA